MSFCENIKEEILEQPIEKPCCQTVFLYTAFKMCGSIESVSRDNIRLKLRAFSMTYVRKVGSLLKKRFGISIPIIYKSSDNMSRKDYYQCVIDDQADAEKILDGLGLKKSMFAEDPPPEFLLGMLERKCCCKTFLKSIIISSGYFQDPGKSYHFEVRLFEPFIANIARRMFKTRAHCEMKTHLLKGGDAFLLYSKSFENFARMLAFLGSTKSRLDAENVKIIKEIKNDTNRGVNFEAANLKKTAGFSSEQIKKIKLLMKSKVFETLSKALVEAARLRIANPHHSLAELAVLVRPKISKSAINCRLNRLMDIYEDIYGKKDREILK